MAISKLCRICLAKDVRMYDLVYTNLQETYESLTAMQFETKDRRPSQVCYICYAQLQTCHKLRSKSFHSEALFCQVSEGTELKLASLHNVTPLLTMQLVTNLSIVPVSPDITDIEVKNEKDDDPSLDCSNIIDNVQVKTEHVEGTEDVFDADEGRIVYDNDENNVSEGEDTKLPLSAINNSEHRTSVASRYDVCPKTVKVVLKRLESTNIVTTPMELRFTERENRTVNGEEVVNDSSEEYIKKTGYLSSHIHTDMPDRPYKCDIRGKCFKRKKNLSRHTRLRTVIKDFGCDICEKYFTIKIYLIRHIIECHPDIKLYVCNTCGEERKSILTNHILTHTSRAYVCDVCGKSFKGKCFLSKHICKQTGVGAYTCNICGKGFTSNIYLKSHILRHTKKKKYACDICGKTFKQKSSLVEHIHTHTRVKPYTCDICEKVYTSSRYLKSHFRRHTSLKTFTCDICRKSFKEKRNLLTHIRTHTCLKPYTCNICSKSFKTKCVLSRHIRRHTGIKPYTCNVCGKGYKGKEQLSQHNLTHTGVRAYPCDVCGKGFTCSIYLKKHILRHININGYICDICGKGFKGKDQLSSHIFSHTGIRAYACDVCGKGFTSSRYLKKHIDSTHMKTI